MFLNKLQTFFTYTRSERNGVIVLLIIVGLLAIVRIILPKIIQYNDAKINTITDTTNMIFILDKKEMNDNSRSRLKDAISKTKLNLFFFNPNTISKDSLSLIGLNSLAQKAIINYRKSGGIFYNKEDILKIYGIDSTIFKQIKPYIRISNVNNSVTSKISNVKLLIELNTADSNSLKKLHGIGQVFANRIIKYRDLLGGYSSKNQLLEVYGIKKSLLNSISEYIFIEKDLIKKIDINKADYKEIIRHPYFDTYMTKTILKFREITGQFKSLGEIKQCLLLKDSAFRKIEPYLEIN